MSTATRPAASAAHAKAFEDPDLISGLSREDRETRDEVDPKRIERLAYAYWEERGRQDGFADEDWSRAERTLREELDQ